ncbi:hypothetical protein [Aeromonas salmonicida]|uniref:hypothetical protein n=1 Tax=Aeromonas salmonicida TaxID=645 RepID=UPI000F769F86|nr:hypothetical protein [Aeromonas salmonicida]RSM24969.1 hypothetical protein C5B77_19430 [Aeromonas salmonicida]
MTNSIQRLQFLFNVNNNTSIAEEVIQTAVDHTLERIADGMDTDEAIEKAVAQVVSKYELHWVVMDEYHSAEELRIIQNHVEFYINDAFSD